MFKGYTRHGWRTKLRSSPQIQNPESGSPSTSGLEYSRFHEEENCEVSILQVRQSRKEIWEYFVLIGAFTPKSKVFDREKQKANCKLCGFILEIKDGCTTYLEWHLRNHHPTQYKMYSQNTEQGLPDLAVQLKAPRINSTPIKEDLSKQLAFDLELTKMLVMTNSPLTFADSPWFKHFISTLDPGLTVKNTCNAFQTNVKILCTNTMEAVDDVLRKDLPQVIFKFGSSTGRIRIMDAWVSDTFRVVKILVFMVWTSCQDVSFQAVI